MIYSVDFLELAEKINPLAFVKYLKDTGWILFQTKKSYVKIFQLEREDNFYQVTIPMDKVLRDYREAMYKAISIVAEAESKSIEELILYLLNPNTDILKIRLNKKGVEAGNILFDDAIKLYENAKKLLAATALDIIHPKKYHQGRIDDAVSKFLSSCRYGQTEIGSYIVSVVCPFAEFDNKNEFHQLSIFSDEEKCENSLTRKVTSRLMSNISTIKRHIDDGETSELSNLGNDNLISANFYEALVGLNLSGEDTSVEFMAEWSPAITPPSNAQNRIMLTNDYYQPIQTAIDTLKEETSTATKIIGRIKKLESSPDVQTRRTGKITVVYLDDTDKRKTVTVDLEKSDYDRAIEAHEKGSHVEIIGKLSSGKRATMTCESFGIID